jgi:hypothetical protein
LYLNHTAVHSPIEPGYIPLLVKRIAFELNEKPIGQIKNREVFEHFFVKFQVLTNI